MRKLKMNCTNDKTFKQGFEEFIFNCKARNLREGTINHYKQSYIQIIKYFDKDILINNINERSFNSFVINVKRNKNVKSQTLHTYCRDLKTIFYFFMEQDYMQTFKIKLPRVDKKPVETYTDEELEKLLRKPNLKKCNFVEYRDYIMTSFFLSTGVRLSSLVNIRLRDLDLENEVVNIIHTKNRKALIIPLNCEIIKLLKEYLKYRQYNSLDDYLFCSCYGKQLNKSSITQTLKAYNNNREVEKTGIHRLRHTFAKKWVMAGNKLATLQKILGHSSLQMTQNYINLLVTDLKEDVNNYNILQEFNSSFIKLKK